MEGAGVREERRYLLRKIGDAVVQIYLNISRECRAAQRYGRKGRDDLLQCRVRV